MWRADGDERRASCDPADGRGSDRAMSRAGDMIVARTDLFVVGSLVAALAALAVEVAMHGSDVAAWGAWSSVALVAVSALASTGLWLRWWRDRRTNIAFTAAGASAWALGQATWLVGHHLLGHASWPGPGSIGVVAFPILTGGALVARLRKFSMLRRIALLSDAALMTTSAGFVTWELWVRDGVRASTVAAAVVLVLVPVVEIGVAALAMVMVLQERSMTLVLGAGTCAALAIGDTLLAAAGGRRDGWHYAAAIVCWISGFVLVGAIAGRRTALYRETNPRPNVRRVAVVYAPALIAPLVAIRYYLGSHTSVSALSVTFAVLFVVALAFNQFVRAWESSSYANRLTASLDELSGTEAQLRTLLDDLPQAVVVLDATGRIREANRLVVQLTGRDVDDLLGTHFSTVLRIEDLARVTALWQQVQQFHDLGVQPAPVHISFPPPANPSLIFEIDASLPLRDPNRVVVTLRDVTGIRQESEALERARERFRLAFHAAPIGMVLATAGDGVLVDANASFASMLGTTVDRLVGRSVRELMHPDDWGGTDLWAQRPADGGTEPIRMEKRYLRTDGTHVWARLSVSVLQDVDGGFLTIGHVEDVTEQRRSAEQLRWAATHDELTRLPNRARFMSELTERMSTAPLGTIAVLFIDLDNFKVINDSLGHATGDQLLRGMTERLRGVLRGRDMLSRFGGDEFIVMLSDCSPDLSPKVTAERLRTEIGRPLSIDGVELFVTGSIGIAMANLPTTTASDLLRDADAAMYRAKARGRDCVEVFAPGVHESSVLALRTAGELRRAVERDEIVPYYQPIIDLASGVLTGFEVLARWRHPDRGLLGADQFLPMAEETGLINDVGASILRSSLVQLGRWRDKLPGFGDLTIAVNVSGRQLLSNEFVDVVGEALAEAGVPAGSLWLEITETALMTDVKAATIALRELRSIGLHLSVDDFGTGYSSLTYLKRFPVEAIKVDRSFVNGLGIDAEDSTIVEAVVNLGQSLGLKVVAEGVETPLQLSRLRELGCDRAQGYLFGRPRPAEIIEAERAVR